MTELEHFVEAVRQVVTEAINGDGARPGRPLLVHEGLQPEWRVVVTFSNGHVIPYDHETEAEALAHAGRLNNRWRIERRLVSAWTHVPPPPGHGPGEGGGR